MMNVKEALQDFLEANKAILTGSGSETLSIYRDAFPTDKTAVGIVLLQMGRIPLKDIRKIEDVTFDFIVYAPKGEDTFLICNNLNILLDELHNINLNDDVNCMWADRNSGPDSWIGAFDLIDYQKITYDFRLRDIS